MFYVKNSNNSKLGSNVDVIYSPIKNTCPNSCSLKNKGCYAQNSFCGLINKKLESDHTNVSAINVAKLISKEIYNSYNIVNKDLRLFVSGDSRTIKGTRLINSAVGNWKLRGGRDCWSYTHAWKHVPRSEWSNVSILASVNSVKEVALSRKNGYAPALVVSEHLSNKVYKLKGSDIKWIPCPNQIKDNISCSDCRLCFNADRLYKDKMGIAFAAHGIKKNNIKRRLDIIG